MLNACTREKRAQRFAKGDTASPSLRQGFPQGNPESKRSGPAVRRRRYRSPGVRQAETAGFCREQPRIGVLRRKPVLNACTREKRAQRFAKARYRKPKLAAGVSRREIPKASAVAQRFAEGDTAVRGCGRLKPQVSAESSPGSGVLRRKPVLNACTREKRAQRFAKRRYRKPKLAAGFPAGKSRKQAQWPSGSPKAIPQSGGCGRLKPQVSAESSPGSGHSAPPVLSDPSEP